MTMDANPGSVRFDFQITERMSALEAGLEYLRGGRNPVFTYGIDNTDPNKLRCTCGRPDCERNAGKHPIRKNWPKAADTEEQLRDEYLSIRVKSNVGLILGEQRDGSYLVAVDVDDEARFAQLETELGALSRDTATCASGRGYRLFYRIPEIIPKARLKNRTALTSKPREPGENKIPGVDVKVGGGQVVVAPSLHLSGKLYEWSRLGEVLTLPVAWCEPLLEDVPPPRFLQDYTPDTFAQDEKAKKKAAAYLQKAVTEEAARLAYMPEGARNDYLYRKAIRLLALANSSYSIAKWEYVLRQLENAAVFAGLGRTEVRKTLASAEKFVIQNEIVSGPRPLPVYDKPEPSPEAPRTEVVREEPPPAPVIALVQDRGQNAPIAENVARLLNDHPAWNGGPQHDRFSDNIFWPYNRPPMLVPGQRFFSRIDRAAVQAWCLQNFQLRVGLEVAEEGVRIAARRKWFDLLIEWVNQLPPWDGVPRLDRWLTTYLGCADTPYYQTTGRSWFRACIERAMNPGLLVDIVPILIGRQNANKNYAINVLFESPVEGIKWVNVLGKFDPDKLDLKRIATTHWIVHDDEFKARDPKIMDRMKSWISQEYEQYLAKYEMDLSTRPRRCLLICSANEKQVLYDSTGNRRWLPWTVGRVDIDALKRDRVQLFAEAKASASWREGLNYELIEQQTLLAEVSDPLRERLLRLATETVKYRREDGSWFEGTMWSGWASSDQLCEMLGLSPEKADQNFAARLGRAVASIKGMTRRTGRGAGMIRFYLPPRPIDAEKVRADLQGFSPDDLGI